MNISASDVNKLRQQTGAGMMDCKKALTEANGDFEEAVVILRKKGQKVSASRADREANEGVVVAMSDATGSFGILVEVTCETDFVAKNEDFGQLARRVAQLAMDNKCTTLDQLQGAGIDGITVAEKMIEYTGKIGEKISVSRYETLQAEGVLRIASPAKIAGHSTPGADGIHFDAYKCLELREGILSVARCTLYAGE
ncbi:MAG: translation elongation factor Ts, partial [Bacteroidota bacterium]